MAKGILLQPANRENNLVIDHLRRTILQTVDISEILKFQNKLQSDLEKFKVWGVVPATKSKWEKLQIGDLVAFYSKRKFYLLGQIVDKFHNKDLAEYLWDRNENGETWEYIYLIDPNSLLEINIDLEEVIKILGYSSNFILQSAMYYQNEKLIELFTDKLLEKIERSQDIITTLQREKVTSTIEKYKRDYSFSIKVKQNYNNKCAICGIPNEGAIVDAAHVKPVKDGGPDIEENGIALCKIHHHLFDAGLITIKNKKLIVSSTASLDLQKHPNISDFIKKEVDLKKTSEVFLKWHNENIFKG